MPPFGWHQSIARVGARSFQLHRDALNILHKLHILNAVDMLDIVRSRLGIESDVT